MLMDTVVVGLDGNDCLSGLQVRNVRSGEQTRLQVEGVFVAVGQEPNNGWLTRAVQLDQEGYVVADESCRTSENGVFAAGDGRTKEIRQLATAAADGVVAGLAACRYLDGLE